jgi:hypothetical protein
VRWRSTPRRTRSRADLLIEDVPFHGEMPMGGPRGDAAMRQARIAAARVLQPEVEARLAGKAIYVARKRGQRDEAFRLAEAQLASYRARGLPNRVLHAVISLDYLRISRADPGRCADRRPGRDRIVGEDIPRAVRSTVHRDDLVAHVERAAPGDLTSARSGSR